jgi:hypothetical protein
MKLRTSFVSNSSTTSFLIHGVYLNLLDCAFDALQISDICGKHGLTVRVSPYDDLYIGRSYDSLKDDETGASFRYTTKVKIMLALLSLAATKNLSLKEAFGEDLSDTDIRDISEAWHD